MTILFCKICMEPFEVDIALISRQYLSENKIFVLISIKSYLKHFELHLIFQFLDKIYKFLGESKK